MPTSRCLPRYLAAGTLARGELVPLFGDWKLQPLALHLAYPPGRQASRKLRVFIDWGVELLDGRAPDITRPALTTPGRPHKKRLRRELSSPPSTKATDAP